MFAREKHSLPQAHKAATSFEVLSRWHFLEHERGSGACMPHPHSLLQTLSHRNPSSREILIYQFTVLNIQGPFSKECKFCENFGPVARQPPAYPQTPQECSTEKCGTASSPSLHAAAAAAHRAPLHQRLPFAKKNDASAAARSVFLESEWTQRAKMGAPRPMRH
jgi:hypothetical protein